MQGEYDFKRAEITDTIRSGPAGGPDFKFQVKVSGAQPSKHLSATADQLRTIADIMDETNPPSLLPLMNGCRVLRADVSFDDRGVGTGVVLAHDGDQYVTWRVWLHRGECRWLAETGDYLSTFNHALISYNERRSG